MIHLCIYVLNPLRSEDMMLAWCVVITLFCSLRLFTTIERRTFTPPPHGKNKALLKIKCQLLKCKVHFEMTSFLLDF